MFQVLTEENQKKNILWKRESDPKAVHCLLLILKMYLKSEKWFRDFRVRRYWSCSIKKLFLKISQNLQESASMGVSFSMKESCNLIKKINSGKSVFSVKFWRTSFLQAEAATVSKKLFLKISQISPENTCVGFSF